MSRQRGWAVLAFLVVACGGSSGSGASFTNDGCTLGMSGTYTLTYTLVSGTCGSVSPVKLTIAAGTPGSPAAVQNLCPGGSGSEVATPASNGGCTLRDDFRGCQRDGQTADISGETTWNSAYTSATGTQSIDIEGVCSGSYTIAISESP